MQTIIHEPNCCWLARDAVALLRRFPITESLPLVKEWLAGEGYGVAECKTHLDENQCWPDCDCAFDYDSGYECRLNAHLNCADGCKRADPSKCPAMLKAAKEARDVQRP